MRIAILTQYYPPEMGAPQARLSDLARRLVERRHDVTVLTAMPNYPTGRIYEGYRGLFRKERQGGISIIRTFIYPTKSTRLLRRLTSYFSFVLASIAVGAIALPKADYLITESPPLFLGISGYLLSRLKGARWIFNVSDLWPESAVRLGVLGDGLALRIAGRLEAFCYQKAWLVTGQSGEIVVDIQGRFPDVTTYCLSNGVDTSLFSPRARLETARRELQNDSVAVSECIAVYAGLHGIAQGLDQILDAAARLPCSLALSIVLIGDGPEKSRLEDKSRALGLTRVRFLPHVARERIPMLLASADIAIVPLRGYLPGAVPSKLYEAMAAGIPVVLVADGEGARLTRQAECGLVVRPGDIEGIAAALAGLAGDPGLRRRLGAAGRAVAERDFDRRRIGDRFIDHLEAGLSC